MANPADAADQVRRLFEHMEWADARVGDALAAVLRGGGSPPPAALDLYAHVLAAELVWLDRVQGRAQSVPVWPEPVVGEGAAAAACTELAATAHGRRAAFVDGLDGERLSRLVAYTNSAGRRFETPLGEILLHVALHGAYHRGQIATLLSAAGHAPAPTDFIAFVRGAAAATRADAEPS